MKIIWLSLAGIISLTRLYSQTDTGYRPRQLNLEEASIISSYYTQDGNNAAVTGGIGSQSLTDLANIASFVLTMYRNDLKHSITTELGVDHYTSASSDMVDNKANSSASRSDTRFYPSINWDIENLKKKHTIGFGVAYSSEFDYKSYGLNIHYSKQSKNQNTDFSGKFSAFFDQVSLIYPTELANIPVTSSGASSKSKYEYPTTPRNTLAASFSIAQVLNKRLQIALLADIAYQSGYLSLPFHRVYFNNGSEKIEKLPSSRLKIPLGIRANYFLGDQIILRGYYRFYKDDWNLTSHTFDIEIPIKLTPFISFSPFYRHYIQSAIDYFAAYKKHATSETYYSSNYDYSAFESNFFGAGLRAALPKGILGIKSLKVVELRYGAYAKNINFNSNIISINLQFK